MAEKQHSIQVYWLGRIANFKVKNKKDALTLIHKLGKFGFDGSAIYKIGNRMSRLLYRDPTNKNLIIDEPVYEDPVEKVNVIEFQPTPLANERVRQLATRKL